MELGSPFRPKGTGGAFSMKHHISQQSVIRAHALACI